MSDYLAMNNKIATVVDGIPKEHWDAVQALFSLPREIAREYDIPIDAAKRCVAIACQRRWMLNAVTVGMEWLDERKIPRDDLSDITHWGLYHDNRPDWTRI